jgi:hypothetical protein
VYNALEHTYCILLVPSVVKMMFSFATLLTKSFAVWIEIVFGLKIMHWNCLAGPDVSRDAGVLLPAINRSA